MSPFIMNRLQARQKDQVIFLPYNLGNHWVLVMIDISANEVYYLDSIEREPDIKLKLMVNIGMKILAMSEGKRVEPKWQRVQIWYHSLLDIMDADTKCRIRETAVKILQAAKEMQMDADVSTQKAGDLMMTEDGLCATVSGSLGMDLSGSEFQLLFRDVMKSSDQPNQAEGDEEDVDFAKLLDEELEKQSAIDSADDIFARMGHRLICRLAANKLVTVTKFKGQRMVSLRKWYPINGKLEPCEAGIHLKVQEWIKLRDAMNDVDQVIATMQNAKPGGR